MPAVEPAPLGPADDPAQPAIAGELLAWYDRHRRALPWRALPGATPDPYAVWLSEIMLQQTTVQAVKPYYAKFLELWPTVEALAAAPTEAVMQAWAGLGYYSRARNLHACAIVVARDHDGRFPPSEAALRGLPGIGAYTAAAIAAIAFGQRAVVVDGNVERVMARLYAVETPLPRAKPELTRLMATATPASRAGDFAQATMDLGATICTPRNPACAICPLRTRCRAVRTGLQAELPRRSAKAKSVMRHGSAYFVTDRHGAVLVRTRPPHGLLGGMAELPGTEWRIVEAQPPAPQDLNPGERLAGRVTHVFTHFTLFLDVIVRSGSAAKSQSFDDCRWVDSARLDQEALPTLMRNAIALARQTPDSRDPARASRPSPVLVSRRHRRN